jgi:hypothetical protein
MIDVRIICSHDAFKLAETLTRLLEAEEHRVRLLSGRQSVVELEDARETKDAIILIWSPDARSQTYMREWGSKIASARIIDLTLIQDLPPLERKVSPIDFGEWRGERSLRNQAWRLLNERLQGVARALNPPKPPPKYAALALGVASAAAVAGAVALRLDLPDMDRSGGDTAHEQLVAADPSTGLGGPMIAVEPASVLDTQMLPVRNFPDAPLMREPNATMHLASLPVLREYELRDPTIIERLSVFNPLRDRAENGSEPTN